MAEILKTEFFEVHIESCCHVFDNRVVHHVLHFFGYMYEYPVLIINRDWFVVSDILAQNLCGELCWSVDWVNTPGWRDSIRKQRALVAS